MTLAQAISIAIQVSMALMVFCIALGATFADIVGLLRRPALLAKSLVSINIVMPALAVAAAVAFELPAAAEVALVAYALSPIPPVVPGKELKVGGTSSYVLGLLVVVGLVSVAFVPLAATALGRAFSRDVDVSVAAVAWVIATSIVAPVVAGILVRRLAPSFAGRIAKPLSLAATVILVVASLPPLVAEWPAFRALLGSGTLLAAIAFAAVGLAVGHLLGGPVEDDRSVLALSTASRHPAVAMAIAHTASDPKVVLAAVLLFLIVGIVVTLPYVRWRRRVHEAALSGARAP